MINNSGNPTMYIGGKPKGNYTDISTKYIDKAFENSHLNNSIKDKQRNFTYERKKDKHLLIYEIER
ncbi:hypothetical protein ACFHWD_19395 [Clostridium sp. MT-14]|jgi:hypothetical protein|uniref:Uncharacterized protein n=1 Tax=Clostridium aromativorans TaxID=2836848 RepID=A0ABS8NAM0_9CLOT|nr:MULTISPECIES: hypothetical protein [Clostridium]KAA8666384.1 hypothetical protein F3O63_16965 [Clostridium sp. HV4-5-A1G]MCC9296815.1 hypothetical protein [Clostridium aromativorans]CAB1262801.1 conserved hypothetical protein [Clostridiaceae bacterium BL-3]